MTAAGCAEPLVYTVIAAELFCNGTGSSQGDI